MEGLESKVLLIAAAGLILIAVFSCYIRSAAVTGKRGEKEVRRILRRIARKDLSCKVINNLLLLNRSGGTCEIDHLLISRYGIFCIETKAYRGDISGTASGSIWYESFRKSYYKFYNPVMQNSGHVSTLTWYLQGYASSFQITPVVVFTNARSIRHVKSSVPVIKSAQLKRFILDHTDEVLTKEKVVEIYKFLEKGNKAGKKTNKEHVEYVKQTVRQKKTGLRCPKCGGSLRLLSGRYGMFYGCCNYPSCRYTRSAEDEMFQRSCG